MQFVFQTLCCPCDSRFRGCFVAGHTTYRARLVDKLAGSWGIFIDFIPELGTSRSPEAVLFLFVHTNDFYGGSDSHFPFVDIPAYFFRRCVFRHSTGDGVFSGCGRRELEHAFHFSFHDLTVHTPLKTGIVEILQQRTQENRTVGKSVPVRGCLQVRRGREFDNVGHRFHDLYAYVFRCCPIYIGSVDCHRINTEFFFIESISILGGNDFSFPYPFDFEPFDIRMLNIGSKCVIGIPDDF